MILIVGLGNPGEKYKNTWHNLGFTAIDRITQDADFPELTFQSFFNAWLSKKTINSYSIILAKPKTFMNLSGKAVAKIINFYKINPKEIIVIHDDIDLPLGKIKIVKNRGSAGHKGVQSIINEIKNKDFVRIRIGVSPLSGKPSNPERFVLQKINKDKDVAKKTIEKAAKTVNLFLEKGLEKAISEINK